MYSPCVISPHSEHKKPPVFDVPLKPVTVNEGEKLSLRCHVRGSPPIKIQWMRDRKELQSSTNTKITFTDGTACLDINQTSRTDAGDYLCKATNDAGSEFCKSKVTVKGNMFIRGHSFFLSFFMSIDLLFVLLQRELEEHLHLLRQPLQLPHLLRNWTICSSSKSQELPMFLRVSGEKMEANFKSIFNYLVITS